MIWFVGAICFLGGAAIGILLFRLLASDEARVKELEERLQALSQEHELYKTGVHEHFNNSAQLLGRLTESYRDIYVHMAAGARSLCPDYISSQLSLDRDAGILAGGDKAVDSSSRIPAPPLDYAARATRTTAGGKGLQADEPGLHEDDSKG